MIGRSQRAQPLLPCRKDHKQKAETKIKDTSTAASINLGGEKLGIQVSCHLSGVSLITYLSLLLIFYICQIQPKNRWGMCTDDSTQRGYAHMFSALSHLMENAADILFELLTNLSGSLKPLNLWNANLTTFFQEKSHIRKGTKAWMKSLGIDIDMHDSGIKSNFFNAMLKVKWTSTTGEAFLDHACYSEISTVDH